MAIGMMLSGIFAGFTAVVFSLLAGHSILLTAILYPLTGSLAALAFLAVAMIRQRDAAPARDAIALVSAR